MNKSFSDFYLDTLAPNSLDQAFDGLRRDGLLTFGQMCSKEQLIAVARALGVIRKHRDADLQGVSCIAPQATPRHDDSYLGLGSRQLFPHTDGSSMSEPACLVMTVCAKPAQSGGASILVDGRELYRSLNAQQPRLLEKLTAPRSAIFGAGDCPFVGSVFTKLPDGRVYVRFRHDRLGYYSAPVASSYPTLLPLIMSHSFSFRLAQHQGYIVQNGRWLHGRTAFSGDRALYRVLIDPGARSPVRRRIEFGFTP